MGDDSSEFPTILSDEEFEALQNQRRQLERAKQNAANVADDEQPTTPGDGLPESTIEQRFPHIAKMLVAMWPSEAFALYVNRLVVADRETRAGFPRDVIDDLLMLDEINSMLLRNVASKRSGPVYTATDRNIRRP